MNITEAKLVIALALAACPTAASFLDVDAVRGMRAVWADVLADLPVEEVRPALLRYLGDPANAGKIPSPGHIRGIVDEARHGQRRVGGDAWGDVGRAIGAVGQHRSPVFADPITAFCVERLGWRNLCVSENAVADRAQFVRLYDAEVAKAVGNRVVAGLPGAARPALAASSPAAALVAGIVSRFGAGGAR